MKALGKRTAALGAGLLLAALSGELAVRATVGSPLPERYPQVRYVPDAHRGFALVPGDRTFTYDCEVRVNAHGLRGPEIPPEEEGELRILLLGDSLTFGHGLREEETLAALLEARLRESLPDLPVRVVNGGHQGFSTRQEVDMLVELGEALRPDVVCLLWLWNDIQEKVVQRPPPGAPKPPPIAPGPAPTAFCLRQWVRKSALLLWLKDLDFRASPVPPASSVENALGKVDLQLARFAEESARLGARPAFCVLPDAEGLVHPNRTGEIDARAAELARGHGLPVITVAEEVRRRIEEEGRLPVLPFDGHYDASGNEAIADGLHRGLREAGLLAPGR